MQLDLYQLSNNLLQTVRYLYLFFLDKIGLLADYFTFEVGKITFVNSVSDENFLNGDRAIIYGTYHMLEGFM